MAQTPYSGSPSRPRSAAQHYTMMKQRAESDFHYLLSHLLQFSSNQEQNYLNRAVDEMHRALRTPIAFQLPASGTRPPAR